MLDGASLVTLPTHGGGDGILIALEENSEQVPFSLQRTYYIYGVKDTLRRGFHAHKTLKQLLVCVSGSCDVLLDNGSDSRVFHLTKPNKGLVISKPLWREMFNFSSGCVLMVLASEKYNTEDYIWDYDEFKAFVGINKDV